MRPATQIESEREAGPIHIVIVDGHICRFWASWSHSGIGCTSRRTLLLDSNVSLHGIAARS